jgi:hypothetical protein
MKNKKTYAQMKTLLGSTIFIKTADGTALSNKQYCSKTRPQDSTPNAVFVERGTVPQQGKRNDLEDMKNDIKNGMTLEEVSDKYFSSYLRYRKSIEAYIQMHQLRTEEKHYNLEDFEWTIDEDIHSLILWGNSGIGKTEFAKALLPGALFVSHIDDLRLYDAKKYTGIIFDDMNFTHMPRNAQIHLTDWDNARSIHIRYNTAFIPANTKKIFTCNDYNGTIFDLNDAAVSRRVRIMHLKDPVWFSNQ